MIDFPFLIEKIFFPFFIGSGILGFIFIIIACIYGWPISKYLYPDLRKSKYPAASFFLALSIDNLSKAEVQYRKKKSDFFIKLGVLFIFVLPAISMVALFVLLYLFASRT